MAKGPGEGALFGMKGTGEQAATPKAKKKTAFKTVAKKKTAVTKVAKQKKQQKKKR
jgi:hypothetical protein